MAEKAFASTGDLSEKTVSVRRDRARALRLHGAGRPELRHHRRRRRLHGDRRAGDASDGEGRDRARGRGHRQADPLRGAVALPRRAGARRLSLRRARHRRLGRDLPAHRRARAGGLGFGVSAASRACSATPESIPGLTWPTLTFEGAMSVFLGRREVKLLHLGAGHTAGDIVAFVPDAEAMFSGDLVEYRSACYCGDAHLREWPLDPRRDPRLRPEGARARPRRRARGPVDGARGDRHDARLRQHALRHGRALRRPRALAKGDLRGGAGGHGPEIREPSPSTSTACPSTSPAPTTRRPASTIR